MNPIQTQANYLFTINFNILHLHPDLVVGLFPSRSPTKIFQSLKFLRRNIYGMWSYPCGKSTDPFTVGSTTNKWVAGDLSKSH